MSTNKATAVDFERGASPAVWSELEALRDVNSELLGLVRRFRDTVQFYIDADVRKGDDEGARLKSFTLAQIDEAIAKAEARHA